jgi:hypothetical protein
MLTSMPARLALTRRKNCLSLLVLTLVLTTCPVSASVEKLIEEHPTLSIRKAPLKGSVSQFQLIDTLEKLGIKCVIQDGLNSSLVVSHVNLGSTAYYSGIVSGDVVKDLKAVTAGFNLTIERSGKLYQTTLMLLSGQIGDSGPLPRNASLGKLSGSVSGSAAQEEASKTSLTTQTSQQALLGKTASTELRTGIKTSAAFQPLAAEKGVLPGEVKHTDLKGHVEDVRLKAQAAMQQLIGQAKSNQLLGQIQQFSLGIKVINPNVASCVHINECLPKPGSADGAFQWDALENERRSPPLSGEWQMYEDQVGDYLCRYWADYWATHATSAVGTCILHLIVTDDGKIRDVSLMPDSGETDPALTSFCEEALRSLNAQPILTFPQKSRVKVIHLEVGLMIRAS